MYERDAVVGSDTGLHARPATLMTKLASSFKSEIEIIYEGKVLNAKSVISVLSGGIKGNKVITIQADGPDEEEAVEAIADFFENKLKTK